MKKFKMGGALLVDRRMRVLFLSIETNIRAIYPLIQTSSLIYSHFCPNYIPTLCRYMHLIDQLQYLLRSSYFAQDNA